jgi:hypothetical protein
MATRQKRAIAGDKTICIPVSNEEGYAELVEDLCQFREYLDEVIKQHRELFPEGIEEGYRFHGYSVSRKQENLMIRRICLLKTGQVYQLRPDFVMPYGVGKTEEVEKGLYLRRYGVPYDGIAHVLGHDAMYWWRATQALGRASIVGSTVKDPEAIPPSAGGRRETQLVVRQPGVPGHHSSARLYFGHRAIRKR